MREYFVYIMTNSLKSTLYVGVTNDITRRVDEHRNGKLTGFTKKYRLHYLVYCEVHEDIDVAIQREKQLKRWRREWKDCLITEANPEWRDLSRDLM